MTLEAFLRWYFGELRASGVDFCVLRNYRSLPASTDGHDIDLLIAPHGVPAALRLLSSTPGVTITTVTARPYVVNVFLWGVNGGALQVDLVRKLSWKGIPFYDVGAVLRRARPHPTCPWIPVPDPVDEAVTSFFTSLLLGGFVKAAYASQFQGIFRNQRHAVLERLEAFLHPAAVELALASAVEGRYNDAVAHARRLRASMSRRALRSRPLTSAWAWVEHHAREIQLSYSSENRVRVVFLGPDGAGKSTVLEGADRKLRGVTKRVRHIHLRPTPYRGSNLDSAVPVTDPHGRPPKAWWSSHAQIAYWISSYWVDRFTRAERDSTLTLYDRYFHDVLVDPRRYRYGGSAAFARALARLVPRPAPVIVLDAPADVLQSRKQEVPLHESQRQREAYRRLAVDQTDWHLVDASRPSDDVVEEVVQLIVQYLSARTRHRLARLVR